jgi:antitoxin component of RelBE/YafQ-DinJ toxin-antitoxin module
MNNTILQVPINKNIRDQAATAAERMGFSSLQEIVRLFLSKVARQEVNFTLEEAVQLSPKAIKRYDKIIDEIDSGKTKLKSFTEVDSLMKHLNDEG